MKSSPDPDAKASGTIRRCSVGDATMLQRLGVETYIDTFDGTSSDEDMRKFLEETYAEPVLRKELANPDSAFFVISMPAEAQVGVRATDGRYIGQPSDSVVADSCGAAESFNPERGVKSGSDIAGSSDSGAIPAGYIKLNFGDAQIEDMGPEAMEIQRLYIQKGFKGCGLGTQLMNMALDMARDRNLKKVWLGVWEHNEPAKRFYADKGFVRVGQHAFWQGDDKQTDYLMAKDL